MIIDLNSDMGELADGSIEQDLMPYVTSANVACGAHAGDEATMHRTVELARALGVAVGAHPGYPDRVHFGRVEMAMTADEIARTVFEQIRLLLDVTGAEVAHVKPHGALYNVAVKNAEVAEAIADGVARWSRATVLVGLGGPGGIAMLDIWRARGFRVAAEGFADRRYESDGSLRSRKFSDALITDPAAAAEQAVRLAREGRIQTLCIHSDTPGSVGIAQAVASALREAGVTLRRLAA